MDKIDGVDHSKQKEPSTKRTHFIEFFYSSNTGVQISYIYYDIKALV